MAKDEYYEALLTEKFMAINEDEWLLIKSTNTDRVGLPVIHFAESLAKGAQYYIKSGMHPEDAINETLKDCGYDQLSGFAFGFAVSILGKNWVYGKDIQNWYIKNYGKVASANMIKQYCFEAQVTEKFMAKDEEKWEKAMEGNSDIDVSVMIFAKRWAKSMQYFIKQGFTVEQSATNTLDACGYDKLSGFSFGCAVSALEENWAFGKELQTWYDKVYSADSNIKDDGKIQ